MTDPPDPAADRDLAAADHDLADLFARERSRLFGIVYRMLGSVSDAEDLVQEAFVRYQGATTTEVRNPAAFLTTVVTRLAIDQLKSARHTREQYVGSWLPEPLLGVPDDASEQAVTAESVSMAFLVLLESLSPVERAVFLLREAFDYGYRDIAEIVGRTPEHCRQLALRARRHVDEGRPRFEVSLAERDELAARFFAAGRRGDVDALAELLSADCVLYGDGGGKAPSIPRPLHGRARAAKAVVGLFATGATLGVRFEPVLVNGQPGGRTLDRDGRLVNVVALDIADGQVQAIRSVVNPDKLRHLGEVSDVRALIRGLSAARGGGRGAPDGSAIGEGPTGGGGRPGG